jgi:hypothetical protein
MITAFALMIILISLFLRFITKGKEAPEEQTHVSNTQNTMNAGNNQIKNDMEATELAKRCESILRDLGFRLSKCEQGFIFSYEGNRVIIDFLENGRYINLVVPCHENVSDDDELTLLRRANSINGAHECVKAYLCDKTLFLAHQREVNPNEPIDETMLQTMIDTLYISCMMFRMNI